jgi:1,4-dihydroxy-2-naphthoate octaprenyltransferase
MIGVGLFMTGMGYFTAQGQLNNNFFIFAIPLTIYGLFFIITVELPDKECDSLANKKTLVVKYGQKTASQIAFLATLTATIYFTIMATLKISYTTVEWTPFLTFSIIPLSASLISITKDENNQESLTKQVMLNITSLTLFVTLSIVSLLIQSI